MLMAGPPNVKPDKIYDKSKRAKEVLENLKYEYDALSKSRRDEDQRKDKKSPYKGDLCQEYLENMEDVAKEIELKVAAFEGPHFTKLYRTINAIVAEHQIKLDAIDVTGRPEIRLRRKAILDKLNDMTSTLNKKIHQDGKYCSACEIQKL